MLNNNKIRTMNKLALFEQGKGKEDIRISRFYKTDFIRYNILNTIVSITIGYALLLVLIGVYNIEYLISKATELNYKGIAFNILSIYIVLVIAYVLYTITTSSLKYKESRKRLVKYNKDLKRLGEIYRDESIK